MPAKSSARAAPPAAEKRGGGGEPTPPPPPPPPPAAAEPRPSPPPPPPRRCIRVMKQRSNCAHFWPVQVSRRASIRAQSGKESGSSLSSARSPVSVVFSHSRRRA